MANPYSILHNYDQPVYSPDFNFINAALSFKQNNLNANRAKLQNLYDQFASLKVAKDVDQKYIENRLEEVRNITNQYASMDLSDPNFASSLMMNMGQVIDDNVKTAVFSTRRIQAEDAEWADKKKNKPELYSSLNHSYAVNVLSDRQRYLTTQEVGDSYKGGADFVEYRDLSKKFMDNLPKIQDALKATWVQTGPQEGYFKSLSKMEAVDRSSMEGVLNNILDAKDLQQIRANAWGTYGNSSDESLKSEYDSYYHTNIQEANEKIQSLKVAQTTETGAKLQEVNTSLAAWEKRKNDIQSNSYDAIVTKYGKSAAYTTLYRDKYFDSYLDAYSYAPREIDRSIDDISKANIEFEEKVRHNKAMENKQTGKGTSTTAAGGNMLTQGVIYLDDRTPTPAEDIQPGSGLYISQVDERKALTDLNKILADDINPGDYAEIRKQFSNLNSIAKQNGTITINGQKVNVAENLPTLLRFQNNVLNVSPQRQEIRNQLNSTVNTVASKLSKVVYYGGDFNANELPQFNWQIGKDKNGNYVKQASEAKNNYARLLKLAEQKGGIYKLDPEDRMTLKAYTSFHMIADPDISGFKGEQKRELFKTLRDDLLKELPYKEFNKIAGSYNEVEKGLDASYMTWNKTMPNTSGNADWFTNKVNTLFNSRVPSAMVPEVEKLGSMYRKLNQLSGKEKEEQQQEILRVEASFKRISNLAINKRTLGTDYFVSEITAGDLEYYNKEGREVSPSRGLSQIVSDAMVQVSSSDTALKRKADLTSMGELGFSKDSPYYNTLSTYVQTLGVASPGYSGVVKISMEDENGVSQPGMAYVSTFKTAKGSSSETGKIAIPIAELQKNTGIVLNQAQRTDYSSKFRTNAAKIDLGNGSQVGVDRQDPLWQAGSALIYNAEKLGIGEEVQTILSDYNQGKYTFKVEVLADNQPYSQVIYKDGQKVFSVPTDQDDFSYEDVAEVYKNSSTYSGELMKQYILQRFQVLNPALK